MPDDIRIEVAYPTHPKIVRLRKMLGEAGVLGHIYLLCHAGTVPALRKGQLKDMEIIDIAEAAKYRGDPETFVNTLVDLRLLDHLGNGTYAIHDWDKHNTYLYYSDERSKQAKKAAETRWKKRKQKQQHNAGRNAGRNTKRNPPSPVPSPFPSRSNRETTPPNQGWKDQLFPEDPICFVCKKNPAHMNLFDKDGNQVCTSCWKP